ncbi:GntR family transcriptional regulator [Sphingomonas sanguinis]|uniref:GntR family transcriptional regulator n=1 Tax=Sphingomonas sanguinis TaxID=33051 RepID=UPI001C5800D5|nr:GntR family transcriptional regulator [Sphingomonas sanguinis]QXT34321.1 GntR family transcriptional regulator [Sphingomonas sanguinis]
MDETLRLQPAMVSRKLLVLAFIRAYIARWGGSPSIKEIVEGTGSSRDVVRHALRTLTDEKLILRRQGARGIFLPDRLSEALRELRAYGYIVDDDVVRIPPPPQVPELDFDPG